MTDLSDVRERLARIEADLGTIKDAVKVDLPKPIGDHEERIRVLETWKNTAIGWVSGVAFLGGALADQILGLIFKK
jgi:hypothetical protein